MTPLDVQEVALASAQVEVGIPEGMEITCLWFSGTGYFQICDGFFSGAKRAVWRLHVLEGKWKEKAFAVAFLISAVEGKAGGSQFYCDYQMLCSPSESLSRAGPVHTQPDWYCSEPRLRCECSSFDWVFCITVWIQVGIDTAVSE